MSDPLATPNTNNIASASENSTSPAWSLRAFTGSLMAGTIAMLFYKMLTAIATAFANKPVVSDNITVVNLSAAVRTLVLGVIALGTGVFAMAAIGLSLLGLQMIWQRLNGPSSITPQQSEIQD